MVDLMHAWTSLRLRFVSLLFRLALYLVLPSLFAGTGIIKYKKCIRPEKFSMMFHYYSYTIYWAIVASTIAPSWAANPANPMTLSQDVGHCGPIEFGGGVRGVESKILDQIPSTEDTSIHQLVFPTEEEETILFSAMCLGAENPGVPAVQYWFYEYSSISYDRRGKWLNPTIVASVANPAECPTIGEGQCCNIYSKGPSSESICDGSISTICNFKGKIGVPFRFQCESGIVSISADHSFVLSNWDHEGYEEYIYFASDETFPTVRGDNTLLFDAFEETDRTAFVASSKAELAKFAAICNCYPSDNSLNVPFPKIMNACIMSIDKDTECEVAVKETEPCIPLGPIEDPVTLSVDDLKNITAHVNAIEDNSAKIVETPVLMDELTAQIQEKSAELEEISEQIVKRSAQIERILNKYGISLQEVSGTKAEDFSEKDLFD